jgi:hypothetical protein
MNIQQIKLPVLSVIIRCFAIIFISNSAQAQGLFSRDEAPDEQAVVMPAAPKFDKLLPFVVSGSSLSFALDPASISLGATDRVLRFTVVVTNASGGRNVSYEGVRCANAERRVYAFGKPDGSWSPATGTFNDWQSLARGSVPVHQLELAKEVLCDVRAPNQPRDIVRKLGG